MTSDPVPPARTSGLLSVQQSGNVQALVTWPSSRSVYGSMTVPVPKARPVVSPTLIDSAPSKSPSRTLAGTFTGSSSLFRTSIKPAVKHFVEIRNSVTRGTRPGQQHGRLTPGTRVTAVTGTGSRTTRRPAHPPGARCALHLGQRVPQAGRRRSGEGRGPAESFRCSQLPSGQAWRWSHGQTAASGDHDTSSQSRSPGVRPQREGGARSPV